MASPEQGQCFPEEGGGDGVDRISGLPEELLLHVLVRLGCAREAARTAVLARRWRGLSTRLPEYTFRRGVAAELVEAALTQVTRTKLDRLHIEAARLSPDTARGRASSLLLAAARLQPEELSAGLILFPTPVEEAAAGEEAPIELPCLDRTRSLALCLPFPFTAPAAALARLESLHVTTCHDIPELSTWPRLRLLRIYASTRSRCWTSAPRRSRSSR